MPSQFEKAYGCLAGLALGDALGMPTEFLTPEQIMAAYGRVETLVAPPPWHPYHAVPRGHITDDTAQALALAAIYLSGEPMSAAAAARALLAWAEAPGSGADLFAGPSLRQALQALRQGAEVHESGRQGTTNGAAMRVAPIGIVHAGDRTAALADAVQASLPTHGTTLAISGAAAIACAVSAAMAEGATVDAVLEAAAWGAREGRAHGTWVWSGPLEHRIALAVRLVREATDAEAARRALYDYVGVGMAVMESIPTALALVALAAGDPMAAIRNAANLGGDTDTIGAISGAICGALRGIRAIDCDLLAQVEQVNGLDLAGVARGLIAARRGAVA